MESISANKPLFCKLPRRTEAIKAVLSLLWKKQKKDIPKWILKEVSTY